MVRREVSGIERLKEVVGQSLHHGLLSLMGGEHNWFVLTEDTVSWFGGGKEPELARKLSRESRAVFDADGRWTLRFYVLPRDGSVQRWVARGAFTPFSIADLQKTVVEKAGALPVVPFTGR